MTETLDWHALSKALDHALELGTEARAGWLDQLQHSDPQLAARVRPVLANRGKAADRGFLDGVADATVAARHTPALVGAHVGPYVIEAEAGRGGMGSVWRARRADGHFEGVVAVKFLNLATLDTQGERRFRREGLLLGKLDHPNVARLLDAGVQRETNQPYLVLEFVDGLSIDDYCERHALDLQSRVRLFVDVLNAVAHAHSHLVIHGDIKPSNILVTRGGVVKLLDFGIARLADDESDHTRSSVSPLTPQYAAPEQLLGEFITTRTDIYGLGLVLYRLLSGRHAVQTAERGGGKLLAEVLERDPPPPSSVLSGDTLRRQELAGDLDNIVSKALRKTATERYQSAGAFADDLQRFLRHEPVTARRDTIGYRVGKFVRRHRGGVASAMLTVLALVAATVVTTQQMLEARRQRDTAVLAERRADAVADFLQLIMAENRPLAKPPTVDELISRAADLLEMQYGDDRNFVAEMYIILAGERSGRDEVDEARRLFELATTAAHQARNPMLALRAQCKLAFEEAGQELLDAAQARLNRSGWKRGTPLADWETEISCLRAQANIWGAFDEQRPHALTLLEEARGRIERERATHDRSYTAIISHLGVMYRGLGDLPRALELSRLGGRIHEQNGRGSTRSRLLALNNEAVVLWDMGEIRTSYEASRRLMKKIDTLEPAGTGPIGTNYAGAAARMQNYQEGLRYIGRAIEETARNGDRISELTARVRRVNMLQRMQPPGADIDLELARVATMMNEPGRKLPPDIHFNFSEAKARQAAAAGRFAEARKFAAEALAGAEARKSNRYVFRSLRIGSQLALEGDDARSAYALAQRGVPIARQYARADDSSADVGELVYLQARAADRLGAADARALYERAVRCFDNGYGADHPQSIAARRALQEFLSRVSRAA